MKTRGSSIKILTAICLLVLLTAVFGVPAFAAGHESSPTGLKEGVTVYPDRNSPTGFTAVFIYNAAGVTVSGAPVTSVAFSGNFMFARAGYTGYTQVQGSALQVHVPLYTPAQWERDMFPLSLPGNYNGSGYYAPMTNISGTTYWEISMPLPSGGYAYSFVLNGIVKPADATHLYPYISGGTKTSDPANPPISVNGDQSASMAYVPFDPEKQSVDYSFVVPRKDKRRGQLVLESYTAANGSNYNYGAQPLWVYLPHGYNPHRRTPYKLILLLHGAGGNESDWFNTGSAANIMDNLIAEGKTEPAIVVSLNATTFAIPASSSQGNRTAGDWYFYRLMDNVVNNVIPYLEKNYNVSTNAKDRAFAGLSKGGNATSIMYYNYPTTFGYFGLFSGAYTGYDFLNTASNPFADPNETYQISSSITLTSNFSQAYYGVAGAKYNMADLRTPKLFMGVGYYDNAFYNSVDSGVITGNPKAALGVAGFQYLIGNNLIGHQYTMVNGAHDNFVWTQLLKIWATKHLWK